MSDSGGVGIETGFLYRAWAPQQCFEYVSPRAQIIGDQPTKVKGPEIPPLLLSTPPPHKHGQVGTSENITPGRFQGYRGAIFFKNKKKPRGEKFPGRIISFCP